MKKFRKQKAAQEPDVAVDVTKDELTQSSNESNAEETASNDNVPSLAAVESPKKWYKKNLSRKQKLLALGVSLVLIGVTAWGLRSLDFTTDVPESVEISTESEIEEPIELAPETASSINTANATFFDKPEKLGNLKLYKNPEKYFGTSDDGSGEKPLIRSSDIKYYRIGTTADDQAIVHYEYTADVTGGVEGLAVEVKDEQYEILLKNRTYPIDKTEYNGLSKALSSNVKLNNADSFEELKFKLSTTVSGQELATGYDEVAFVSGIFLPDGLATMHQQNAGTEQEPLQEPKLLGTEGNISYYLVDITPSDRSTFNVYKVNAVFKELFYASYVTKTPLTDYDKKPKIDWAGGENTNAFYLNAGPGCGSGYIVLDVNQSQLKSVGSYNGETVYQLPVTHPFVKDVYKNDYKKGEWVQDKKLKNLSIEEFSDKHGYFIQKNKLDQYAVYLRSDMIARGGCGKPVIYLYPEQATSVSVSVGADITKSVPLYPAGGWKQVLASPDGQLTYRGQYYPYLFWEGYGNGEYPDVKSSGVIVPKTQAVSTMRQQLKAQGLRQHEINDFVEFWEAKLPTDKPYIRLSWLTKGQIDTLAPLRVLPQPRTVIRVFLEFEGVDKPYQISAQKFSAPSRNGFTVVEWGGLLTDGSERN